MIRSGLFNSIGAVLRMAISIVSIPLLIRIIGVEGYGIWTLVSTVVAIATLAEAGLSVSTTVFLSKDLAGNNRNEIFKTVTISFTLVILLGVIISIFLYLVSHHLITIFTDLSGDQLNNAISASKLGGFVVAARLIQRICVGIVQAYQAYGLLNIASTIQAFLTNFGMLIVATYSTSVLRLMQWHLASSIIILGLYALLIIYLLPTSKFTPTWCKKRFLDMIQYGGLTWLSSIGSALFSRFDKLFLSLFIGTEVLGIYAAFTDISSQINSFSAVAIQPILPEFSKQIESSYANISLKEIQCKALNTLYIHSLITATLGGLIITLAPFALKIVLPEVDLVTILIPFQIVSAIYTVYSLNAVGYYMMLAFKKAKTCTALVLSSGIFSLFLIVTGAKFYGLLGAILGNIGYIATLSIIDLGMKYISIPRFKWIKKLVPFSLWFSSVLFINAYLAFQSELYQDSYQRILIFVIQNIVMAILLFMFFQNRKNLELKKIEQAS